MLSRKMRRYRVNIAYDGSNYYGWQVQPGLPTVQGVVQRILSQINKAPVQIMGSGRTDAGVHAAGQVAAFDLQVRIPPENLQKAMNRLLPKDIRVIEATLAAPGFHPRHHAVAKTYRYRICRAPVCPPFERLYVWHLPYPLDEQRMIAAAPMFEGHHDFRAFAAADERYTPDADLSRQIFSSVLHRNTEELVFVVRGSGFLKHMVRNLIGALVEVGVGNLSVDDLCQMFASAKRHAGIRTAPPSGLTLMSVEYPPLAGDNFPELDS